MTLSETDLETLHLGGRRASCPDCGGPKPAGRGVQRCGDCAPRHVLRKIATRTIVDGDCLIYTGSRDENGYGRIYANGKQAQKVHRLTWEAEHGAIPPGMVICHTCDNPPCCNPDHLFSGTVGDNNRDREAKGRSAPNLALGRSVVKAKAAAITHWPHGHPYLGTNVRFRTSGARYCGECSRIRSAARTRKAVTS